MATTNTATTNFNQTVIALVQKRLEELLRAPLPHLMPGNFRPAQFVKGTNNTMRFINIADMSVVTGTPTPGVSPWLTEAVTPTAEALVIGYEEFSANQAGRLLTLSDLAMLESPFDLMAEAANRVARNAIATADKRVADVLLTGTNVMYSNGSTASAGFPLGSSVLKGSDVKLAVAKLANGLVPTFPDGTYHAIIHPGAVYDLQSDTSVGGWIDAARYAGARQLMTGELGEYAGVRFQSSAVAGQRLATVGTTAIPQVTSTNGSSVLASTAHGLSAGQRIRFSSITGGGTAIVISTNYYVVGPVTANAFSIAATAGGAAIVQNTAAMTASVSNQVYDVNSTTIFGPEAYAFGDWTALETYFTAPGGPGDELHQRASVGWKGFFGAVIMGQGANATGVTGFRYIRIESVSAIS